MNHGGPTLHQLLQIICSALLFNNVERRLSAEPASSRGSNGLICVCCVIVVDLYSLLASASGSSICHQLRMTALLEAQEPEHCGFNGSADREKAMIL